MRTGLDSFLLPAVVVLAAFFVGWYLAGNEVMRRRARGLVQWCKQVLELAGGTLSIQWLTMHSFRMRVDRPRLPLESGIVTGLTESWDVPVLWLWNRSRGRRDMVLVELTLRRKPIFGLELYRPGSLLAGDARHAAQLEGWREEQLDEFRLAAPGDRAHELAHALLTALADQRRHLVRIAVRRQAPNLAVAINVPPGQRPDPPAFHTLLRLLVERTLAYASPGEVS